MLIGELAQRSGVAAGTIRFYERHRLLSRPPRTDSGYRLYPDKAVREIAYIKTAQAIGLSLDEIREILDLGRGGRLPCKRVVTACDVHLAEIDRRMAELRAFRARLQKTRTMAQGQCGLSPEGFCNAILPPLT